MATETRERITDPERLGRLEGAYAHLATKEDLAALEVRLTEKIAESNEKTAASERRLIMWGIGIAVSAATAVVGIMTLMYRLFGG